MAEVNSLQKNSLFYLDFKSLANRINFKENRVLLILVALKLLIHLVTGWQYGYFRDELYYFAMSEHPDFGYVDVSPVVPWLMRFSRFLFGDSVFSIHILPALAGAITVLFAGLIAKKLGGGKFAVAFTAIAVIAAPVFLAVSGLFSYDCFDQLMSVIFIYILACIFKEENNRRLWIYFGIIAGIGLMVKISFMFLGFCLLVSILLSKQRRLAKNKWLWIGGGIAFLIVLPYIIWQATHGGLILEYWYNYGKFKTFKASPLSYIMMEAVMLNPLSVPLWISGLYFLLFSKKGKDFMVFGLLNVTYLVLAIFMSFKFYILAGTFFAVIAAGAIAFEGFCAGRKLKALKYAYPAVLLALGLLFLPVMVPVIPIDQFIKVSDLPNTLFGNVKIENSQTAELPQIFADRFGWEDMVKTVADVYNKIPAEEQKKCAIFASNYGEAGAVDFFGAKYGLPKSISSHLSYYVWGPRDYTGEVMIIIGLSSSDESALKSFFSEVEVAATTNLEYAMPYENNRPIYLCKKPIKNLKDDWPRLKKLD